MQKGFTLIEVLIVMVIISIVGGVAILTISHNQNTRLENLAKQITNVLLLAEEQAMLQPAVFGVAFTPHAFQFYEYQEAITTQPATWVALSDNTLGKHPVDHNIQLTLKMPGMTAPTSTDQPPVIISNNGDITPFKLLIGNTHEKPRYQVIGMANGSVSYERI